MPIIMQLYQDIRPGPVDVTVTPRCHYNYTHLVTRHEEIFRQEMVDFRLRYVPLSVVVRVSLHVQVVFVNAGIPAKK